MWFNNTRNQKIDRRSDCGVYNIEWVCKYVSVTEERRTRWHGVTLAKKQCRLDIRNFSFRFSQRTVN